MKFNKLSQLFLVSITGLLVATLLTSCDRVTIDYILVANSAGSGSSSTGQIQTYDADEDSGALRAGQPAVSSGGNLPVSMAVTSDYANLYVANQGNNSVVHFSLAGNGVLTQKDMITAINTPVAIAVNATNTYLYVISGTTSATLTEYSLSNGTIGSIAATEPLNLSSVSSAFAGDTIIPTGITVLVNDNSALSISNAVYVTAYDQSAYNPGGTTTSTANPGWIFGFTVGSGGALTAITAGNPAVVVSPWKAGVKPSAIASDPTNRFIYATDFASNELIGYTIQSGGALDFLINGPFKTGNEPSAITIDPRGKYIYVTNALDSTVTPYDIVLATGTPSVAVNNTGTGIDTTDTQPVAVVVDAALGAYVYTANHLGNSVSGFKLNANTGALSATVATPYPGGSNPTALVSVPHGNHAIQTVTP
jgi:6-phosphogluconolactonase (cycloisomerase 2 family)